MQTWEPGTIRRFVKGFPSSARTALVETDIGLGYLKAMGGPEGPHTLASEVVMTQLASWFGLPTFDWNIIRVDDLDEIPFLDRAGKQTGHASPGPAFITRAEQGITWGGGERELKLLVNPEDISRLVVFDTWVLNCDRRAPADPSTRKRRKPNRDNVFLSEEAQAGHFRLKAMDHTHCITCGREWTKRVYRVDTIRDPRVFGLFPEFRKFLMPNVVGQAANDLRQINVETVSQIVARVPNEWELTRGAREALIKLVVERAKFVAGTIQSAIWPQKGLAFEDDSGDPEL